MPEKTSHLLDVQERSLVRIRKYFKHDPRFPTEVPRRERSAEFKNFVCLRLSSSKVEQSKPNKPYFIICWMHTKYQITELISIKMSKLPFLYQTQSFNLWGCFVSERSFSLSHEGAWSLEEALQK
jgi:hypothetical protein